MVMRHGLLLIPLCVVASAQASDEGLMTVFQPVETSGAGNIVSTLIYIGYTLDWENQAAELMLTVQPNLVWCDGKAQERNGVVVAGIRFKLASDLSTVHSDDVSDTLRVV